MKRFVPIFHQSEPILPIEDEIIVYGSRANWFSIPVNQGALRLGIDGVFAGHATGEAGNQAKKAPAKHSQIDANAAAHPGPLALDRFFRIGTSLVPVNRPRQAQKSVSVGAGGGKI